jgi:hypothetical protein
VTGVEEQKTDRVAARAGGPRVNGTWLDDAGETRLVKMTDEVTCDPNELEPGWSISTLEDSDGDGTTQPTYRSVKDSLANNRLGSSDPLTCVALVSPKITLSSSPTPSLQFRNSYNIEQSWDGVVVEVSNDSGQTWQVLDTCPYDGTFSSTTDGGCDTDGDGTGDAFYDCEGDGTNTTYINMCDYPPTQGAYTGPAGNGSLTPWGNDTCSLAAFAGETIQFRFNLSTDCGSDEEGMYLDDIQVVNAQLESACTPDVCATPPEFAGLASAIDNSAPADTGVDLTWPSVSSWGGGGTGTFEVYADGQALATGLTSGTTTYNDNASTNNTLHSYRVVAKGGTGCDIRDGNDVDISAADCVDPLGADVDSATLMLVRGSSNVEITSTGVPNANEYRFYFSNDRTDVFAAGTFIPSPGPAGSHDVLTDGLNWYYKLKVTDGGVCGNTEVP